MKKLAFPLFISTILLSFIFAVTSCKKNKSSEPEAAKTNSTSTTSTTTTTTTATVSMNLHFHSQGGTNDSCIVQYKINGVVQFYDTLPSNSSSVLNLDYPLVLHKTDVVFARIEQRQADAFTSTAVALYDSTNTMVRFDQGAKIMSQITYTVQ